MTGGSQSLGQHVSRSLRIVTNRLSVFDTHVDNHHLQERPAESAFMRIRQNASTPANRGIDDSYISKEVTTLIWGQD